MVDRINKFHPHDHLRVDPNRDATEDEGKEQTAQEEEQEEQGDEFAKSSGEKENWKLLTNQAQLHQKKIQIPVEEISEMTFLDLNTKTNPSLIHVKIYQRDGLVYPSAYLALSRHEAITLQHMKKGQYLPITDITDSHVLSVLVPDVEEYSEENSEATKEKEIEKSEVTKEMTLSQTIKMIVKKTWAQRLGWQDPETKSTNIEIVGVYVTILVILASFSFAVYWIIF